MFWLLLLSISDTNFRIDYVLLVNIVYRFRCPMHYINQSICDIDVSFADISMTELYSGRNFLSLPVSFFCDSASTVPEPARWKDRSRSDGASVMEGADKYLTGSQSLYLWLWFKDNTILYCLSLPLLWYIVFRISIMSEPACSMLSVPIHGTCSGLPQGIPRM